MNGGTVPRFASWAICVFSSTAIVAAACSSDDVNDGAAEDGRAGLRQDGGRKSSAVASLKGVGGACRTHADCGNWQGAPLSCATTANLEDVDIDWWLFIDIPIRDGYCVLACDEKSGNCPPGSTCTSSLIGAKADLCHRGCVDFAGHTDCRPGFRCDPANGVCLPELPPCGPKSCRGCCLNQYCYSGLEDHAPLGRSCGTGGEDCHPCP